MTALHRLQAALRAVLPVQAGVPPVAGSPLADIVARVVALERWRAGAATGALPAPVGASQADPETGQASPAVPADPWTSGEGRQKRLTPAGLAELDRRLSAGESVPAIAEALGVSHQTVSKRRAALE